MRQAGRYLPEYRDLRATAKSFLDFCYNPKLAAEATLQPIRRFGFDAAILFSDILVVPDALGQTVSFETGEGPRLSPLEPDLGSLGDCLDLNRLAPVFETIERVREVLPKSVALIGFCGAPWTVATYMTSGRGSSDQRYARCLAYADEGAFVALIDLLVRASIDYLSAQIQAGVDAVQIFDSWAGTLPSDQIEKWCILPLARIAGAIHAKFPSTPIIAFPRGATSHLRRFSQIDGIAALGLDTNVDPDFAVKWVDPDFPLQGNLDPIALLAGGTALDRAVDRILEGFAGRPHILNLGHGVLPETPLANVERLVARARGR